MYSIIAVGIAFVYIGIVTYLSWQLAIAKTNDPRTAALIGFLLSFIPPLAMIYLVILLLKPEVDVI